MSHLGELLSAFVDGELDGAERDRVSAHLARCEQCRAEAAALRGLKRQLRALGTEPLGPGHGMAEVNLTERLLESGLLASTELAANEAKTTAERSPARLIRRRRRPRKVALGPPRLGGPRAPRPPRLAGRSRYVALGTLTLVMGLGTASFSLGGTDADPGPKITPQVELYSEEHAITTGEVPFAGTPAGSNTAVVFSAPGSFGTPPLAGPTGTPSGTP
jgi:anti-sigma factor RsiW